MPKPVDVEGLLTRDGKAVQLTVSGGGVWQVECNPMDLQHLGGRVRVKGERAGFNIINAEKIEPISLRSMTLKSLKGRV